MELQRQSKILCDLPEMYAKNKNKQSVKMRVETRNKILNALSSNRDEAKTLTQVSKELQRSLSFTHSRLNDLVIEGTVQRIRIKKSLKKHQRKQALIGYYKTEEKL